MQALEQVVYFSLKKVVVSEDKGKRQPEASDNVVAVNILFVDGTELLSVLKSGEPSFI